MNRLTYYLCVSLPLTSIAFFSIGFAQFTLFNALVVIFLIYLVALSAQGKAMTLKVPVSLIFLSLFFFVSNIFLAKEFKTTSLIYSIVIIAEIFLMSNIARRLSIADIKKIARAVILLFFITIIIESLLIMLHIVPSGLIADLFVPIYYYFDQTRPMGLSSEPSYAAITIVFALYLLLRCNNFQFNPRESMWYLMAIAAVILSGSSFGYALLALLLLYSAIKGRFFGFIARFLFRNPVIGVLAMATTITVVVLFFLNLQESIPFQRLAGIYKILSESGLTVSGMINIANKDGSAGMRIVPTIQLVEYFTEADLRSVLFGRGAGQATLFYSALYGQLTLLGFIPSFIFNYGIIGFLICLACLNPLFPKRAFLLKVLFFFFLLNADFNTQIFVYVMFVVLLSKQMEKKDTEKNYTVEEHAPAAIEP